MLGAIEPRKVPWVRSFCGQIDAASQRSEYFRKREDVMHVEGQLKAYQETGIADDVGDFTRRHPVEIEAIPALKAAEKQRRKINKQRRALEGRDMPAAERDAALKQPGQQELDAMRAARKAYVAAVKRRREK